MKKFRIEFINERIIPSSGLAVVGAILGKSDFVKSCNRMDVTKKRPQHQIKNGDILLTYIGMLCMGKLSVYHRGWHFQRCYHTYRLRDY